MNLQAFLKSKVEKQKDKNRKISLQITDEMKNVLARGIDEVYVEESRESKKLIQLEQGSKFITFRQNDNFKSKWDLLIMLFAIFNCVFVPLQVSFDSDSLNSTTFFLINTTIDICFFIDMFISFRTVYIDDRGRLISDDKKMAINYI